MDLALMLPIEERWRASAHVELADRAAQAGVRTVLAGEVAGPEPIALLGAVAARCPGVRVGTGVIPIAGRSPAIVATAMATLADLAPAGVIAGLGSGTPLIVERWHGTAFARPVERMREFVRAFRECLSADRAGDGFRVAGRPGAVPVMLGAVGPRMLRLAGEVADSVFLTMCPVDEVRERLAVVHEGERAAGRAPGSVEPVVLLFAGDEAHAPATRDRMRSLLARYASLPTHRPALAGAGIETTDPARIGDTTVDRFLAAGGEEISSRFDRLAREGVTTTAVVPLPAQRGDVAATRRIVEMFAGAM